MSTSDAFSTALKTGDAAKIKELCVADPSLARTPVTYKSGMTLPPIFAAAMLKEMDSLKTLLEIDPTLIHEVGDGGYTLMHVAAACDNSEMIAELCARDGNLINRRSHDGLLPLKAAIEHRSIDAIETLIAWDAHVDEEMFTYTDLSPELHDLLRATYTQQEIEIQESETNPEAEECSSEDLTFEDLIDAALDYDEDDFIKIIEAKPELAKGINADWGATALHLAAYAEFSNAIGVIHKITPEAPQTAEGASALQIAVETQNPETIQKIGQLYPHLVNEPDTLGHTLLDKALKANYNPVVGLLIWQLITLGGEVNPAIMADLPIDSKIRTIIIKAHEDKRVMADANAKPPRIVGGGDIIEGTLVTRLSGPERG